MKLFSKIQHYVFVLTLIFLAIFLVSFLLKTKYPGPQAAFSPLKNDPIQTPTNAKEFTLTINDVEYTITPLFDYELYGMIVSMGDNLGWLGRFKEQDPLNTNDFCIIWGSNIDNGIYQEMSFRNEDFICRIEFHGDYKDLSKYTNDHLSNNHLLVDRETNSKLYNQIKSAKVGDQIHFKGYLASYSTKKSGVQTGTRGSSTTREDSGDGACETVYIKSFEIIKKYTSPMLVINHLSGYFVIYGIIIWIVLFITSLIIPNRYGREDKEVVSKTTNYSSSLPTNITQENIGIPPVEKNSKQQKNNGA